MFKKDEKMETAENATKTIIGPSVKIEGDFSSEDNVDVEGQVLGALKTSRDLRIGKDAKIKAEVEANYIFVAGEVKGNIVAKEKIELSSTAKIFGDITTNTISIENGAMINGKCTSGQNAVEDLTQKKNKKKEEPILQ